MQEHLSFPFQTLPSCNEVSHNASLKKRNSRIWRKLKEKYVGVQSWKAAHLPTLEIRVEQEGNRVKKERKMGKKRKIINATATGNRTRDLSIIDQMSVLTNQVHLKIQFRHRFDQKCLSTASLNRLAWRFAQTSSVPHEKKSYYKPFTSEFSNSIYSSSCIGNLDRLLIYAEKNCKAALLLVMPILPRLFMPFYARASSTLKHASLKLNSWSRFSTMLSIRVQID